MRQNVVVSHNEVKPARVRRDDVIDLAYDWFHSGRRIDAQQLARELGIGRATLYRWWGSREVILGEVVWRIMAEGIAIVEARGRGTGEALFLGNFDRLAVATRLNEPLAAFVADDPEYALRILTSKESVVQERLIGWTAGWLARIPDVAARTDIRDLAYAIVRISEAFIWSDMITGEQPQADKATAMIALLLTGARHTRNSAAP